jgi:hypothetical protein
MDLHLWHSSRPAFSGNCTSQRRRYSTCQQRQRLPGRQREGIKVAPSPSFICGPAVVGWTGPRPESPMGHLQATPAHKAGNHQQASVDLKFKKSVGPPTTFQKSRKPP